MTFKFFDEVISIVIIID